jgi:hypothetical protein
MTSLSRRIEKAEESLGGLDSRIEEYKEGLKKWYSGEIEFLPEPPTSLGAPGKPNNNEVTVFALHELRKEAMLEGREFEPRFGSKGMTVSESLIQKRNSVTGEHSYDEFKKPH